MDSFLLPYEMGRGEQGQMKPQSFLETDMMVFIVAATVFVIGLCAWAWWYIEGFLVRLMLELVGW